MRDSTTSYLSGASVGELVSTASMEPVLDAALEAELARRVSDGDTEALERLVMGNLRVAVDEAIRNRGLGQPQRALVRRGVGVLIEAARMYDPDRHGSFSHFASERVRRALSDDVADA